MASSFFLPSNRFSLRDTVISDVVQRVAPLHVGHKRLLPPLRSVAPIEAENNVDIEEFTKGGRKLKVSASRRERCRINQARYRKRQRQHSDNLNANIQQLQEEIERLETKRQELSRCAPTEQSVWVVATEYFRIFQHGYMTPTTPETRSFVPTKTQQHVQLDFLKSSMATDVTDGILCGPDALLDNWRLFSMYHSDVKVMLKRLEQSTQDSLFAISSISFTITENTLKHLYPHLESSLASKLLRQRLVVNGSVRFDWDGGTGRVVRLESKIDMLTPMLTLLRNLENVVSVFDKALISIDGRVLNAQ